MNRTGLALGGSLAILIVVSTACGIAQVKPVDPDAPVISFAGLVPAPEGEFENSAILVPDQAYSMYANVDKEVDKIVLLHRRLHNSVNRGSWWTVNFAPHDMSAKCPCRFVSTPWRWDSKTFGWGMGSRRWQTELEMWVVDAKGRESNHISVPVVIKGAF